MKQMNEQQCRLMIDARLGFIMTWMTRRGVSVCVRPGWWAHRKRARPSGPRSHPVLFVPKPDQRGDVQSRNFLCLI
ncbi:X-Pro dipeptidyl-peptidase domain-containing protein [Anopheles sinensis]|uniref:X-Pro dipeptidyl-peptidase domain-containing protein n=1 Tax=Anopheles sinensis TaxID=74873 RepID=A0A084VD89_ANOSI|nr:X-Pro dipeptidyl-peptidase domain-containing protein [Anopheles sinensis]